ncbi:MAG: ATP-binding protein, partial [Planctomycetaceae bacterium]|nr:ATP-binding protein [Planctomycetaceae bacterium]
LVRSRAEPKGLSLTLRTEGAVPRRIVTDPTRLKQILLNLVGNAIKFTERGGVTVALRWSDAPTAEGRLQIAVIDTGIGLTKDQQNRLFKAFSQGDTSTTRRFGGTGLGLVISRRLAEMLGGDIAVQSEVGGGATFTISLPDAVAVEPQMASAINSPAAASRHALSVLSGRRILIVDDMPDNRRLISFLLAKTGAECVAVDDGATAIAAVTMAAIDGLPFDLILMDMQMPVLDGYAATRQLRAEGCRLPIVALTANSMSTDRERCLAAGCDDYLSKPIQRAQMYGTIARWMATPVTASATVR